MKKLLFLLPVLFLGYGKEPTVVRLDGSQIPNSLLTNWIQALADSAKVSGLAVTIFNNNEVVYKRAFGFSNAETKEPLTTDKVFYGASLSKAVFGYLVAQLVDEGRLNLDTPLQRYLNKPLPEITFEEDWKGFAALKNDKRYEKITARMCLSHTTGFPNWRWMTNNNDFDPKGEIRFMFDPGARYAYSGEGINLLQFVVEQITGQGLEQMARKRIFDPLDMDMTSYVCQKKFKGKYCHGHASDQSVFPLDPEDDANAAGSMATTPDDYAKFITEVLRQTHIKSNPTTLMFEPSVRIKSKTQFGYQVWEDTDENDDIELSYGLGWGLLKSPYGNAAFKEGHSDGFQHYSIVFPDKQTGIVIMSNSDNAESIFKELLEITIGDVYTPWQWERYVPFR